MPVIAGAGSNSTNEAVRLAKHAADAGADAVLIVSPYYNKPTQEGLYQHFSAVAAAVSVPVIVYDIPGRSIVQVTEETLVRLAADYPNVRGIKDATADISRPPRLLRLIGSGFSQLSGEDATALPYLAAGGHGCISVSSNIVPNLLSEMHNSWKNGDEANWDELNTDIVVLATGRPKTKEEVDKHLSKGCKKVIVASTPENFEDIQIYVPGANDEDIDLNSTAISLGYNTANAVAPILKALDSKVGVERAFLTTVHGYSNSNRLADVAGEGFRLNRAAGENIIPSITKSSEVISNVLPFIEGKIASSSMTVPIPDGSTVDLTIDIKNETSIEDINKIIEDASNSDLKNIIG